MLRHAKQVAAVAGATIEYLVAGADNPPIILINGGDGPIEGWHKILDPLAATARTLAYNRCGVGQSAKADCQQTSDIIVAQLRQLLRHVRIAPPYLLVGHSLGGLHAQYFARMHPGEICGVVLLEATAPDDVALMAAQQSPLQRRLQRLLDWLFDRHSLGEAANAATSARLVQQAGPFPDVPLVVISGGITARNSWMPATAKQGRLRNQQRLSQLSPQGRHITADHSGHFPQFSEPMLVVAAIQDVIRDIRQDNPAEA